MRVAVVGAGAVGGYLAGLMAHHGTEVSVVARGRNLEAIRANGITVHTAAHEFTTRVAASDDPRDLGPQDAVLVSVKAPSLPSVAAAIGALLREDTAVAFVMNGIPWWYFHAHGGEHDGRRLETLDPGGIVQRAISPRRVLGGVIYAGCDVVKPGVVHVETKGPQLVLGEPDGRVSERAEALGAAIRGSGLDVVVSPEIRRIIWSKLQMNMCSGLFGCLTGSPPGRIYGDPAIADGVRRVVAEVGAVAAAMGFPTGVEADKLIERTRNQTHKSSIVQDLEAGRPMEADAMFALPVEFARLKGIPTPTLDLLVALVKARARNAGAYSG
jgi:2-dehydropantoate 2-reductase